MTTSTSQKQTEFSGWSYGRVLKYISILENGRQYDPSHAREERIAAAIAGREAMLAGGWAPNHMVVVN